MASIVSQPATVVSAHRPVEYLVDSDTTASVIEKAVITVYDAAFDSVIGTYRQDWERRAGSGPAYSYRFRCDIAGLVRSLLAPFSSERSEVFLPFGTKTALAAKNSLSVYAKIRFLYRNLQNTLDDFGVELTSNTTTVFNVAQQHRELQTLSPYIAASGRLLMLDAPTRGIPVAEGEAYSLAFVCNTNITTMRLRVVQTNGVEDVAYLDTQLSGIVTNTNKRVQVVGVGPRNLNAIPDTGWLDNFNILLDAGIREYRIDFGSGDAATYTALTGAARFVMQDTCEGTNIRLHWLNTRGGVDAFSFDAIRIEETEGKSADAVRALPWPHDREAKRMFKTGTEQRDGWRVETRIISADQARYVAGLLGAVEVYMETPYEQFYTPVYIVDGKIEIDDSEKVGSILKFQVLQSNEVITHQM